MGIIQKIFPKFAIKREIEILRLQNVKRAYEGAKVGDFYPVIAGETNSPNENMQNAGERMRNRARHFDENLDIVTGLFDTLVNNVVGNSNPIRPLVRNTDGTLNSDTNTNLIRLWNEFSVKPTVCGNYTMIQAFKLACRAWLRDGEYLTRIVKGTKANNTNIPLSIELIEADYLPFDGTFKETGNKAIIQGIEINKLNQVLAFHLLKSDPHSMLYSYGIKQDDTKRIPAAEMIHLKFVRRTHQLRGVTLLHSVMNRLEDLKDYEESERIAARVAAAMTGFVQKSGESNLGTVQASGDRNFEMSPGMIFDNLMPGETINTIASNRPNPELINFRSAMLRAIAAGTGTNYSTISRDYNGTYSSQRQELLETKPAYEALRKQFVDSYILPIWREFIEMVKIQGKIGTSGINKATFDDVEMRGIDIGWIDPKKQADATETSILNGITTRGQVIRDQGGDPAAVFAEIQEEEKIFGKLEPKTDNQNGATNGEETEQDQE